MLILKYRRILPHRLRQQRSFQNQDRRSLQYKLNSQLGRLKELKDYKFQEGKELEELS